MREKTMWIRKGVLRLMLALMLGIIAGGAPGAAMVSHAETAAVSEAAVPAEGASEDSGMPFLLSFFGGILLLILFVVVVAVATSVSTVGAINGQDEE
ncbi:hypothetical protein [Lacrimispora saccharolytica]|uniref:Sulfate transporter n=1 Tax=Lacrimispora saccharolytica (strain ATCC 35040 / DSM 2544 / NRCC 2533 / WM1) TaxID=610130 RepID=D9R8L5_LACSW|nr:hypothetical protein [Lacrimispora saccharolytica]ADL05744.1 hypothetical protein Closa_3214 [[Clostridium] saccharolyticum WM1]QRV20114.1 sulfate transporter [Lacrimispora saccharolytica]